MGNPVSPVYQSARLIRPVIRRFEASPMRTGFATRLAALYAAMFAVLGVQLPFFPLWLKAKGLDAGTIGIVLAAPIVVRIFAVTFAARAADRHAALRAAIMAASAASVLGYVLVGWSSGALAILAAYMAASLAFTPLMPLADAYALKGLAARGRAYGPVRLWGSAAFIGGTFIAGTAIDTIAARDLIWLIVTGYGINALVALMLAPLEAGPAPVRPAARVPQSLLRDKAFVAAVVAAGLIQASHAVYYGFSALAWRAMGFDGTSIAALWALGVAAEIVLFALQARLPAAVTPAVLLIIGGVGGALRWTVMAFDPPAVLLPLVQLLHAFSFGATHLGTLGFIASRAPIGQAATAQAYLAVALGTVMAAATALSGALYGQYGNLAYAAMALAAVGGGAAGYVARRSVHDTAA
jgi:PPP family 3-phenylpropionic acid transporter